MNLEEKAKFFAQYWGQPIMRKDTFDFINVRFSIDSQISDYHLELTPLLQISDEDAIKVFNHVFPKCLEEVPNEERIETVKYEIPQEAFSVSKFLGLEDSTRYIDKVRDLGYALPWMGISVEEQIKRGWVKLKTN